MPYFAIPAPLSVVGGWCAAFGMAVAVGSAPGVFAQTKTPTEQELRASGARQLTAAEVRSAHLGNTAYYLDLRQGSVHPNYFRDERNRSMKMGDGTRRDTVWWMEGDRICYESVTRRGNRCARFYSVGADLRACVEDEAACYWVIRVVPGNPEKF